MMEGQGIRLRSLQSLTETGADKLTVPPHTGEPAARAAMDQAARPAPAPAPALLAAITTAAIPRRPGGTAAGATPDSIQLRHLGMGRRPGRRQIAAGGHIRCDLAAMPG
jgi:hypothetical protein